MWVLCISSSVNFVWVFLCVSHFILCMHFKCMICHGNALCKYNVLLLYYYYYYYWCCCCYLVLLCGMCNYLMFSNTDLSSLRVSSGATCPCSDPKLCEPIKDMTRKEVRPQSLSGFYPLERFWFSLIYQRFLEFEINCWHFIGLKCWPLFYLECLRYLYILMEYYGSTGYYSISW